MGMALLRSHRRLVLPLAGLAGAVVLALVLGGPARTAAQAANRLLDADPRWVVAAITFEVGSFAGYIALLWHVAGRDAPRFDLRISAHVTLAGAAATRLLPTAGAGGAALTLWTLKRGGAPGRDGETTLMTFLVVLYAVFLGAIAVVGGLAAFGVVETGGPRAVAAVPAAGAAAAMLVALALAWRPAEHRVLGLVGRGVRAAAALVRHGDARLLGAVAWWGLDVAVLGAALTALGGHVPVAAIVLGYFVGQVANTIPVPGSASGGMIGVLIAFGVAPELALAGVATYRLIAVWVPAPLGAASLAALRRDVARWERPAPRAACAGWGREPLVLG
jgi:uncharacterized membrane protein YbhN (UPF0104 family)